MSTSPISPSPYTPMPIETVPMEIIDMFISYLTKEEDLQAVLVLNKQWSNISIKNIAIRKNNIFLQFIEFLNENSDDPWNGQKKILNQWKIGQNISEINDIKKLNDFVLSFRKVLDEFLDSLDLEELSNLQNNAKPVSEFKSFSEKIDLCIALKKLAKVSKENREKEECKIFKKLLENGNVVSALETAVQYCPQNGEVFKKIFYATKNPEIALKIADLAPISTKIELYDEVHTLLFAESKFEECFLVSKRIENLSLKALKEGAVEKALEYARKIPRMCGDNSEPLSAISEEYLKKEDPEKAKEAAKLISDFQKRNLIYTRLFGRVL